MPEPPNSSQIVVGDVAGLALIWRSELLSGLAALGLALLLFPVLMFTISTVAGICALVSHVCFCLQCFLAVPRPWAWRIYCLIILSALHLTGFAVLGYPHVELITQVYLGLAIILVVVSNLAAMHQRQIPKSMTQPGARLRWLVTAAPLIMRLPVHLQVQRARLRGFDSIPPAS